MYLGVLGTTGLTAYFGLLEYGKPQPGDTVVVSAAAGAVGSVVGQIAKIGGCRVVGIAGGPEKCAYVTGELGFDEAIDYRAGSLREEFARTCPSGIDVYFDNVGGAILNTALAHLAMQARVVVCGAISQYNAVPSKEQPLTGPSNYLNLLVRRGTMRGFLVFDHESQYGVARRRLGAWVAEGRVSAPETIVKADVADFNQVLGRLFSGDNLGKLILDISA
jgi:NADPH-dependent curcumin reductase CurA